MLNRRTVLCLTLLLAGCIVAARSVITAAPPIEVEKNEPSPKTTFLEHLKPGRAVSLTEKDGRYEIGLYPETFRPLGHTVIAIGKDYIVLRDLANITDSILPVYSVKVITVLRVGGK